MPTPPHERRVFTYTTAPSDYDWFGTATVRVVGHDKRGKPIRLVTSDPKYAQSQRERYASGLHMAVDDTEWEKLVKYNLVTLTPNKLQENPSGGAVAALVGLGVLVVGWLVLSPKKASAAPAATSQPPLPPAQVQPPLPPAPEPQPAPAELTAAKPQPTAAQTAEQPLTQTGGCDSAKIIQYKFKGYDPQLYVYRRLTVWPAGSDQYSHFYDEQGWLPANVRNIGLYYGTFGDKLKSYALDYYSINFFLVEMWVWTSEGWCLDATTRNYTAPLSQSPSQVVSPEQSQAPSQVINQPPQATNP